MLSLAPKSSEGIYSLPLRNLMANITAYTNCLHEPLKHPEAHDAPAIS